METTKSTTKGTSMKLQGDSTAGKDGERGRKQSWDCPWGFLTTKKELTWLLYTWNTNMWGGGRTTFLTPFGKQMASWPTKNTTNSIDEMQEKGKNTIIGALVLSW